MNLNGINWTSFAKEHPSAYAWLLQDSLAAELELLAKNRRLERSLHRRNLDRWQRGRLAELLRLARCRKRGGMASSRELACISMP